MLGQYLYHGPGQAHGLCFSVKVVVTTPPSLRNMYKELSTDVEGFTAPSHGHLVGQGVLSVEKKPIDWKDLQLELEES